MKAGRRRGPCCVGGAGADGVDPDPGWAELGGPGSSEQGQGGLGRPVQTEARDADLTGGAEHVNDRPVAAGGHRWREFGDQQERGADVDGERSVDVLDRRGRGEPADREQAGVVDEDVGVSVAEFDGAASRDRTAIVSPSSPSTTSASPPAERIAATTCSARSRFWPWTSTRAPRAARAYAVARPIPLVAPVTRATKPTKSSRPGDGFCDVVVVMASTLREIPGRIRPV